MRASSPSGDKRIGVIWHTQGSGKSILMAFYTAKLILRSEMQNPTVVVITDRNDLDGQLFGQFCAAKGLIPAPVQAESREHLTELLQVASGGVVFSTIQKFGTPKGERFPMLSDRRNIVVITDEAHRSQYEFIDGFARNLRDGLPNASFIGFTGTPIEFDDRSTPAVFGEYIDTYPIAQSVEDHATVPDLLRGPPRHDRARGGQEARRGRGLRGGHRGRGRGGQRQAEDQVGKAGGDRRH